MTTPELRERTAALDAAMAPLLKRLDEFADWRARMVDELTALPRTDARDMRKPGIRAHTWGRRWNLERSIKALDVGLHLFEGTGYSLENSRLGDLIREAGYEVVGADPSRHYVGSLEGSWLGSEQEIRWQLKDLTARRDRLQAQLAEATLTDAERAERDAVNERYRQVRRSMRITGSADGSYLVARGPDGSELDPSELSDEQREALMRANREHIAR